MRFSAFLVALFALSACADTVRFHARSTDAAPQVTARAVLFHEGDRAALDQAGGRVVGTIEARGNSFSTEGPLFERSLVEAAKHGGTHVIVTTAGVEDTLVPTGNTMQTNCTSSAGFNNCNAAYRVPGMANDRRPTAGFLIVRVDPEHWSDLPPELQPAQGTGQ